MQATEQTDGAEEQRRAGSSTPYKAHPMIDLVELVLPSQVALVV
jgi:hypothetical protein